MGRASGERRGSAGKGGGPRHSHMGMHKGVCGLVRRYTIVRVCVFMWWLKNNCGRQEMPSGSEMACTSQK